MKKSLFALIFLLDAAACFAAPLDTDFTYQGELHVSGVPATGEYDFQFELFDIADLGVPVAAPIFVDDLMVTNGVFSVGLDFGLGPFSGDQIWLEISVRVGDSMGGFTGLLPRQKLTAMPYALHAEYVAAGSCMAGSFVTAVNQDGSVNCVNDDTGLSGVSGEEIVDGTITDLDLSTGSVTGAKLAANAVGTIAIEDNAVNLAKISDSVVGSSEIVDASVGSADIIPSQIQTRVSGSCDVGNYLSGINEDGSVQCAVLPLGIAYTLENPGVRTGINSSIAIRIATYLK